jgi:hypothetical protein
LEVSNIPFDWWMEIPSIILDYVENYWNIERWNNFLANKLK